MEDAMASFKSGLPAFALLALFLPSLVMAEDCKFAGGDIDELQNDSRFTVSDESEAAIEGSLLESNRDFFDLYDGADCQGAWVTAGITEKSSGEKFRYYRTNEDRCDGGNTYGIFVEEGQPRAISYLSDGELTCENPHRVR
jgi:hypothetical protein